MIYICEECGSKVKSNSWCPKHPYAVLVENNKMSNRVIVLSDGTWETVGDAQILTLTDDAYNDLIDGEILSISDIDDKDIVETKTVR